MSEAVWEEHATIDDATWVHSQTRLWNVGCDNSAHTHHDASVLPYEGRVSTVKVTGTYSTPRCISQLNSLDL